MRNFKVKTKMKRAGLFIACYVLLTQFAFSQSNWSSAFKKFEGEYYVESNGEEYRVNSEVVTVKFKSGVTQSKMALDIIRTNRLGYIDVAVPKGVDLVEYLDSLSNSNDFGLVDFNSYGKFCSDFIPNDPLLPSQWYLHAVNVFDAWNITTGDPSVKVAVIDAGPHWGHSDIGYGSDGYSNVDTTLARDFINPDSAFPSYHHGMLVLGQIAAKTNNATGIAGIAGGDGTSPGVTIIPINIGIFDTIAKEVVPDGHIVDSAIFYAVDSGAKIIQLGLSISAGLFGSIDTTIVNKIAAAVAALMPDYSEQ